MKRFFVEAKRRHARAGRLRPFQVPQRVIIDDAQFANERFKKIRRQSS